MVFTKLWWKAALIRAVRTMAQTAVGLIPAMATITDVNWLVLVGTSVLAGVVSMLTSLAGLPEVEEHPVITVKAYEHYDANGDPVSEPDVAREINENSENWQNEIN